MNHALPLLLARTRPAPLRATHVFCGLAQRLSGVDSAALVHSASSGTFAADLVGLAAEMIAALEDGACSLEACLSVLPREEAPLFRAATPDSLATLAAYALSLSRLHLVVAAGLSPPVVSLLPELESGVEFDDLSAEELADQCRSMIAKLEPLLPSLLSTVPPDRGSSLDLAVENIRAAKAAAHEMFVDALACARDMGADEVAAAIHAALVDAQSVAVGSALRIFPEGAPDARVAEEHERRRRALVDALEAGLAVNSRAAVPKLSALSGIRPPAAS